jgi:hypothetical protein
MVSALLHAPSRFSAPPNIFTPPSFHVHGPEMTDASNPAAPVAPIEKKKRSFFKKAAWQTKPKTEESDLFSHSNEFKDIVAEENKRKQEERQKKEDEKKRKAEEEQVRKRRRVSREHEEPKAQLNRSGSSTRSSRRADKAYVEVGIYITGFELTTVV